MKKNNNIQSFHIRSLTWAGACLALCLMLPFLTGQIPQIGSALCPMHLPVLLCGYLCGPWWAMVVGLTAPLLRHFLLTMPPLTTAIAMSVELAGYGVVCGLLYRITGRTLKGIYRSLIPAMVAGRLLWGMAMVVITGITGTAFSWAVFIAGAVTTALPGIVLQLILIPILVTALHRAGYIE